MFKAMLHDDRGDSMVGISVALVLWMTGFALIGAAVVHNMEATTTSVNHGMATNVADATIKNARVMSWDEVGTAGPGTGGLLPAGYSQVTTGTMPAAGSEKVRNLDLAVKTSVGRNGTGASATKMVVVQVSWTNHPSGERHSIKQSTILSPPTEQSSPTSIPTLGE